MKASTLFAVTAAVFLGLIVVAAAKYSGIFTPKPPAPPVVREYSRVLVAAKNLFESMTIMPADVRVREMSDEEEVQFRENKDKYLPPRVEAGVMRVLNRSVEADKPLLREYLDDINLPAAIHSRLSSPQMRAVNVSVPIERAAGGLIQRGEFVDVYLTTNVSVAGKPDSAITQTAPIAQRLKVIVKRNMLWNALAPVDANKPIDYTLEANAYRAALIQFAKTKGELSLVPTSAPPESIPSSSRSVVPTVQSDPASREYQNEDERVAELLRGERSVGEADLERIFNLKPYVEKKPVQIEKYSGVLFQGVQTFGSNGNGIVRPNTGEPIYYQFTPVSKQASTPPVNKLG
jgi:Flp pilus assembly protein CpaB